MHLVSSLWNSFKYLNSNFQFLKNLFFLSFSTVFFCLVLSVLATIPDYEENAGYILMNAEIVIVIWLSIELSLRVWSSGCRSRYQTLKGRLKFMRNVFCILGFKLFSLKILHSLSIFKMLQSFHKRSHCYYRKYCLNCDCNKSK